MGGTEAQGSRDMHCYRLRAQQLPWPCGAASQHLPPWPLRHSLRHIRPQAWIPGLLLQTLQRLPGSAWDEDACRYGYGDNVNIHHSVSSVKYDLNDDICAISIW